MAPRITLTFLASAVIAITLGSWFGLGNHDLGRIETVSAREADGVYGADFCYNTNFGSWCSSACGNENGNVTSTTNKDGVKAKTHFCNNGTDETCKKINWKGLNCL